MNKKKVSLHRKGGKPIKEEQKELCFKSKHSSFFKPFHNPLFLVNNLHWLKL